MTDNLDTLTDQQLNGVLAALLPPPEHFMQETGDGSCCKHCGLESWEDDRPCSIWWCAATDEVIKLLSRISLDWSTRTYGGTTQVDAHFVGPRKGSGRGHSSTLAKAGVLAAIRALRSTGETRA